VKPAEKIEKLIKKSRYEATPEAYDKAIGSFLQEVDDYKKQNSVITEPNIWRIIMKSKITKLAAAATILFAVLVCKSYFGGSINGVSVAFGQIKQAMEQVPWVHSINKNSNLSDEGWLSFKHQIEINKKANGKITYEDYGKKIKYVYSPETETITLSDISQKKFALGTTDLFSFIEAYLDKEQARGAKLIRKNGLYNEAPVKILEITRSENNWTEEIKIFINPENNLPLAVEVKSGAPDRESSYAGKIAFDYPENGPQDIYALSVPRSAKIIDLLPEPDALEVLHTYQEYRNDAPSKYASVVIFDIEESVIVEENVFGLATIIYRDGQRQYGQEYKIFGTSDEYADELGDTFESAMNWCKKSNLTKLNVIDLFTGVYHYQTKYNIDDNKWNLQPREDWADHLGNYLEVLRQKGWPDIIPKAKNSPPHQIRIIENNYAKKYGLICIELLRQGANYGGRIKAMPPRRELYYLNPQKDYICQRHEHYRRRNAHWQKDKSWLDGIDPNNIRPDATSITQVTEYSQTDSGKWYPKVVTRTIVGVRKDDTHGVFTIIETIYLETAPEFPEGIFEPKNLPKAND
jgi:hypothetical protein